MLRVKYEQEQKLKKYKKCQFCIHSMRDECKFGKSVFHVRSRMMTYCTLTVGFPSTYTAELQ